MLFFSPTINFFCCHLCYKHFAIGKHTVGDGGENAHGFSLEGLGFHGEGLERIYESLKQKTGMVLATGPTGSGKTTTLYTMLDILNKPEVNISTVEDPIEYQMPRVNQTQVKSEIGLSFANGLRSLLRQDPDIVMVGEIRDGVFLKYALAHGADYVATGHYAISKDGNLLIGEDKTKDQSYFLWTLTKEQIEKIIFPVGHLQKSDVRKLAAKYNLPTETKKDSQGVCFLGPIDMKEFLTHYIPKRDWDQPLAAPSVLTSATAYTR
jgi:energy-coupling factor transporter ATP-binding protein EcfA2